MSTRIAVIIILPFEFNFESTISKIFSSSLPLPPTIAISILSISFRKNFAKRRETVKFLFVLFY